MQREEYVGQWLPEPIVTDTARDPLNMVHIDESRSMAFLLLLERLAPVERAVLLLREVFEYEYSEIAGGGKGVAVPNLIHGPDNVARAILKCLGKLVPRNLVRRLAQINGNPGLISFWTAGPSRCSQSTAARTGSRQFTSSQIRKSYRTSSVTYPRRPQLAHRSILMWALTSSRTSGLALVQNSDNLFTDS